MSTRENGPPLVSIPLAEHQLLVKTYKRAVAQDTAIANALHSAALTVEWLKQLLTMHRPNALPAQERVAFAQLLNDMGVLDDAGLLYVRLSVETEGAAKSATAVTDDELVSLGERAVHGYLDFEKAREWFAERQP